MASPLREHAAYLMWFQPLLEKIVFPSWFEKRLLKKETQSGLAWCILGISVYLSQPLGGQLLVGSTPLDSPENPARSEWPRHEIRNLPTSAYYRAMWKMRVSHSYKQKIRLNLKFWDYFCSNLFNYTTWKCSHYLSVNCSNFLLENSSPYKNFIVNVKLKNYF